jgi:hypothetical protein
MLAISCAMADCVLFMQPYIKFLDLHGSQNMCHGQLFVVSATLD